MIFSIGYAKLTPERLQEIVEGVRGILIDVRYKPISRKPGFGGRQLEERFGEMYLQVGNMLGGMGNVSQEGIEWLKKMSAEPKEHVILMCQEEAPGDCHRHRDICAPHFPDAVHIYQDQLLYASDLARAEQANLDEYDIIGDLEDLLSGELKL